MNKPYEHLEMETIKLPCYGITINRNVEARCGTIETNLREEDDGNDDVMLEMDRKVFSSAIDALESLILGHALAGVDVESPAYIEGIESAVSAIEANLT